MFDIMYNVHLCQSPILSQLSCYVCCLKILSYFASSPFQLSKEAVLVELWISKPKGGSPNENDRDTCYLT